MPRKEFLEVYKAIAADMQGILHLALLHVVKHHEDGRYLSVIVSTACIPSTTKAEGLALVARPFDMPMIQHRGLTLMSYQRVSLSSLPATCMICVSHAASIP